MVKTFGLTHVAVAVRDVNRASKFYRSVFGAIEVYKNDHFVQLQTPGTRDVLVFELAGGHRVIARPSGTEPKLKIYFDVAMPAGEASAKAQSEAAAIVGALDAEMVLRVTP